MTSQVCFLSHLRRALDTLLHACVMQKRPVYMSKETNAYVKRNLYLHMYPAHSRRVLDTLHHACGICVTHVLLWHAHMTVTHTYDCDTHIWLWHTHMTVTHTTVTRIWLWHTYGCDTHMTPLAPLYMRHDSFVCVTVTDCMSEPHVTESWHTLGRSHVTHMNESCHIYERVMSHMW